MKILLTGSSGFIGMHTAHKLLAEGYEVVGIDNINDYYDVQLKYDRLATLGIKAEEISYNQPLNGLPGFRFVKLDITDASGLMDLFEKEKFE